jgi:hypothetical protein
MFLVEDRATANKTGRIKWCAALRQMPYAAMINEG